MLARILILAFCYISFCHISYAEEKDYRDYIVYYSVFNADFIPEKIANAYNIVRARDRIFVNISVQKKADDKTVPVAADISGDVSDLIHHTPLKIRKIKEGNAIYYLAEFKATGFQRYIFDLKIEPENYYETLRLRFNQQVWAKKE